MNGCLEADMTRSDTARIIPFPTLAASERGPVQNNLAASAASLSAALHSLSIALADQLAAIQQWRALVEGPAAATPDLRGDTARPAS